MIRKEFKAFLRDKGKGIGKYYTNGKVLGLNAINDIIKWAKGVERVFGVDLNVIVKQPGELDKLLKSISVSEVLIEKQKSSFIGAVKAYYEFINRNEL